MPGFQRHYKRLTITTKDETAWKPESFWRFSASHGDVDEEICAELVSTSLWGQADGEEVKRLQDEPAKLSKYLMSVVKRDRFISTKRALLLHHTHAWGGDEFMVPEDYQDDTQEPIGEDDGEPIYPLHEDAGKLAPITAFWIGQRDPAEVERIYEQLKTSIEGGRSPAEEKAFRGEPARLDDAGRKRKRTQKEVPSTA